MTAQEESCMINSKLLTDKKIWKYSGWIAIKIDIHWEKHCGGIDNWGLKDI